MFFSETFDFLSHFDCGKFFRGKNATIVKMKKGLNFWALEGIIKVKRAWEV